LRAARRKDDCDIAKQADEAPLLQIVNGNKIYGGLHAIKESISNARGEIHALLGENGAGKSTLSKAMPAQSPYLGRLSVERPQGSFASPKEALEGGVAYGLQIKPRSSMTSRRISNMAWEAG